MTMMREDNVSNHLPAGQVLSGGAPDVVPPSVRTAWDVIEEACVNRITGEMTLTTAAPHKTKVYLTNGLVYFAEHDSDDTLAARLVLAGALELDQLHRGSIRLNGTEHLGRLFERDTTIDRDSVELAVELITEQTLTDVAEEPVASYRTAIYRHHPSGISRWFSSHQSVPDEAGDEASAGVGEIETSAKPTLSLVPDVPDSLEPEIEAELEAELEPEIEIEAELERDSIVTWPTYPDDSLDAAELGPEELHPEELPAAELHAEELPYAEPVVESESAGAEYTDDASFFAVSAEVEPLVAELAAWSNPVVDPNPVVDSNPVVDPTPAAAPAATWDLVADVAAQLGFEPQPSDPEALATSSMWDAPTTAAEDVEPEPAEAIAVATSTAAPMLPTSTRPVMRISHQPSNTRPAPTVLSNARPEVAFDPNGPRLPGMTMPEPATVPEPDPEPEPEPEPAAVELPLEATVTAPVAYPADDLLALTSAIVAESTPGTTAAALRAESLTPLGPLTGSLQSLSGFVSMTPTPQTPAAAAASTVDTQAPAEAMTSFGSLGSFASMSSLAPLTPLASMTPAQALPTFTPLASVATTATFTAANITTDMTTDTTSAFARISSNPTAPPVPVPDFGSIPVPEDVAAAVRRAITAIEAATASPARSAAVTFGPMHITGAGRPAAFSFDDTAPAARDAVRGDDHDDDRDRDTDPHGVPMVVAPDPTPSSSPFTAMAGMSGLTALNPIGEGDLRLIDTPQSELMDNPIAAPISSARRGALRRLIDGIRRRH